MRATTGGMAAEAFFASRGNGNDVEVAEVVGYLEELQRTDADLFWKKVTFLVAQIKQLRRITGKASRHNKKPLRIHTSHNVPTWDNHVSPLSNRAHSERLLQQMTPCTPPPVQSPQQVFCGGNPQEILRAMKRYKLQEKIQEKGCSALVKILKQRKQRRVQDSRLKCPACLHVNTHGGKRESVKRVGSLRCEMCSTNLPEPTIVELGDGGSDDVTERTEELNIVQELVEAGAIGVIVDALRSFRTSEGIQTTGSYALAQVCHDDENSIERLAMEGGIGVLLSTMKTLEWKREVQAQCLGILASPILLRDSIVRVETKRFAWTVASTLVRFKSSGRIQALGMLALANLGFKNSANVTLLTKSPFERLIDHVFEAVRLHRADAKVVTIGLWLLGSLVQPDNSQVFERLTENECTELCMELLEEYPADVAIQRNVRLLLDRLGAKLNAPTEQANVQISALQTSSRGARQSLLPQDTNVHSGEELNGCRLQ